MLRIYRCAGRVAVSAMLTTFLTTFLALNGQATPNFSADATVNADTPSIGLFTYNYTITNLSAPGEGEILDWRLPFFADQTTAIVGAITAPEHWLFEYLPATNANWTFNAGTDPNAGALGSLGTGYETPSFILRFFADPQALDINSQTIASLESTIQSDSVTIGQLIDLAAQLRFFGAPTVDIEIQLSLIKAAITAKTQEIAALRPAIVEGEAFGGFSFVSPFSPLPGPVLGAIGVTTMSALTSLAVGPPVPEAVIPEPGAITLLAVALFLMAWRDRNRSDGPSRTVRRFAAVPERGAAAQSKFI